MNENLNPSWSRFESSIDTHLQILQSMIQRMSANSAAAKTWAVGLTTGTMVLSSSSDSNSTAWIALLPVVSLMILDVYYLTLERLIRGSYKDFIEQLSRDVLNLDSLFEVAPRRITRRDFASALGSPSIWIFYTPLVILCVLVALLLYR